MLYLTRLKSALVLGFAFTQPNLRLASIATTMLDGAFMVVGDTKSLPCHIVYATDATGHNISRDTAVNVDDAVPLRPIPQPEIAEFAF